MKKILKTAAMLLTLSCLASCSQGGSTQAHEPSVKMLARIVKISDRLEVEVIEGEYGASGTYWVITSDNTEFITNDGSHITRDALNIGNTVEITYGGQVMMSYPPQIVAKSIKMV